MTLIESIKDNVAQINEFKYSAVDWRKGHNAPRIAQLEEIDCEFSQVTKSLPDMLDREDVAECFRQDAYKGFVAACVWSGCARLRMLSGAVAKCNRRQQVIERIERLRSMLKEGRLADAYSSMENEGENRFNHSDHNLITVLLYFIGYDIPMEVKPLIYSSKLKYAHCALEEIDDTYGLSYHINREDDDIVPVEELIPNAISLAAGRYEEYCKTMHNVAKESGIEHADHLVTWLLKGKSTETNQESPYQIALREALKRCRESHLAITLKIDFNESKEDIQAIIQCLADNGIYSYKQLYERKHYDTTMVGCGNDNPFLLNEKENYVHLERSIADLLLSVRDIDHTLVRQKLIREGDRKIDVLSFKVWPHEEEEPELTNGNTENYYFDITKGYDNNLKPRR